MAVTLYKIGSSNMVVDAIASIGGNNLITLYVPAGVTNAHYQSLNRDTTGSAYQVTAGKTLYMVGALVCGSSTGNIFSGFGPSTAAAANAVGAPSGFRDLSNSGNIPFATANTIQNIAMWIAFAAANYVTGIIVTGTLGSFWAWCFEQ